MLKEVLKKRFIYVLPICLFLSIIFCIKITFSDHNNKNKSFSVTELNILSETTTTKYVEIFEETTTSSIFEETTTTLKRYIRPTTTVPIENYSINNGPPRNTTTLVGCIAYYESTWGIDPNVFQFTQSTWEQYGGVGYPGDAPYWKQEEVFWLAWNDDGYHHWAAQKDRCF